MAEKYPKPANAAPTMVDALLNTIAALRQQLAAEAERAEESTEKWRQYEREYVLPLFQRAEERGWSLQDAVRNNAGKNCVILYAEHVETTAEDLRRQLAEQMRLRAGTITTNCALRRQLAAMKKRAEKTEAVVETARSWMHSFRHGRDSTDEGYSVAGQQEEDALFDAVEELEAAESARERKEKNDG